jgi:cytochrome c2
MRVPAFRSRQLLSTSFAVVLGTALLMLPHLASFATAAQDKGSAAAAERGRQLIARYHCGRCHEIPGVAAARGSLAASLVQYGRRSYIAGRVANRPELLARWISDPQSVIPGTAMPDMGVSPADARDIAAYLGRLE